MFLILLIGEIGDQCFFIPIIVVIVLIFYIAVLFNVYQFSPIAFPTYVINYTCVILYIICCVYK